MFLELGRIDILLLIEDDDHRELKERGKMMEETKNGERTSSLTMHVLHRSEGISKIEDVREGRATHCECIDIIDRFIVE